MKWYINTSNYYLSSLSQSLSTTSSYFEVTDIIRDWVSLPTEWYYRLDVDFNDPDKREIFRVYKREWYTVYFDKRISPNWIYWHDAWAPVWLRDFSELLNSLSSNTDNFWYVENYTWLQVRVFWWRASNTWVDVVKIDNYLLTLPKNSTVYIEYDVKNHVFRHTEELLVDNYPLAKVVTWSEIIFSITDIRPKIVFWWWVWDMLKATYDPNDKKCDVFDMDNMDQWDVNKYVNSTQITSWDSKQEKLDSGNNIKTINWATLLWEWNLLISPQYLYWWNFEKTTNWISSWVLTHIPAKSDSFMVYNNSWQILMPTTDYTYNADTHTLTLTWQLREDEFLLIWIMSIDWSVSPSIVWEWTLTVKLNNWTQISETFWANQSNNKVIDLWTVWDWILTILNKWSSLWTFKANQTSNSSVDVGNLIWEWTLTISQGNTTFDSFSANASSNSTIQLKDMILVTQAEYDALPETKTTDWNFYLLYS